MTLESCSLRNPSLREFADLFDLIFVYSSKFKVCEKAEACAENIRSGTHCQRLTAIRITGSPDRTVRGYHWRFLEQSDSFEIHFKPFEFSRLSLYCHVMKLARLEVTIQVTKNTARLTTWCRTILWLHDEKFLYKLPSMTSRISDAQARRTSGDIS